MVQRCGRCGTKIIRFPLWKGQEDGEKFDIDKVIWINLFKIDFMSLIWLAVVLFLLFGYKEDIKQCQDAIERPCEFCEYSNCCQVDWGRIRGRDNLIEIDEIPFIYDDG